MSKYSDLTDKVRELVDDFRFLHIRSVFEECGRLSEVFGLSERDSDNLQTAALLHDISKGCPDEKQAALAAKLGLSLTDGDKATPSVIHAITGAEMARKVFPEYVNDEVLSAVRWHCTGRYGMEFTDSILFLADYIEPRRKYYSCTLTRNFFRQELETNPSKECALYKTMFVCVNFTVSELASSKKAIHPDTLALRTFLLEKLNSY